MATFTIGDLNDSLETRLRVRAAVHGRSMEEEACAILRKELALEAGEGEGLAALFCRLFGAEHGIDLDLPPREPMRDAQRR